MEEDNDFVLLRHLHGRVHDNILFTVKRMQDWTSEMVDATGQAREILFGNIHQYTVFWNSNRLLKLYSTDDAIIKILDENDYYFLTQVEHT